MADDRPEAVVAATGFVNWWNEKVSTQIFQGWVAVASLGTGFVGIAIYDQAEKR